MTTTTSQPSLWARTSNWLSRFDEAIDYDSTQLAFARVTGLQHELAELSTRVKQLEKISATTSSLAATQAAA